MRQRHGRLLLAMAMAATFILVGVPALAVPPGDCNGTGTVDTGDIAYLLSYLVAGGPPPVVYDDCDCDGFEGVNWGDLLQITHVLFSGGSFFVPPGTDFLAVSSSGVMVSNQPDGVAVTQARVFMNNPAAINGGLTLPFSFAPEAGESDLVVTAITTGPTFAASVTTGFDNTAQAFHITANNGVPATTNWELLCTVDFALGVGGAGNPVKIDPSTWMRLFPLIVQERTYAGVDLVRMHMPRFIPDAFATVGDVDCSGNTSIGDAVYIINYIFAGGPPPSDPDNDGEPECPVP